MNKKSLPIRLLEYIYHYNVFIPDEDDYDDDDLDDNNDKVRDPALTLKQQLYTTRLYIPLFISTHFRFLSTLCQLANKTVTDAIQRFGIQSFITLNVTTETSFDIQLNLIVNQFAQSFITNFDLLIQTVQLLTQTDQPYTLDGNALLFYLTTQDEINGAQYARV
ncbi:unnamed protein product [Adineta steineri]|uniref:Uncharacterized protein n=1 Tax=Adineta steineri TaxID=433720 RepID=A0A814GC66_9BILA|nr:unnamed protein product [Adineta steineri]